MHKNLIMNTVQGFDLCRKEQLIQAVMMMRQITFGYRNQGKFKNMKLLPPFEAFSIGYKKSTSIDY